MDDVVDMVMVTTRTQNVVANIAGGGCVAVGIFILCRGGT